MSDSPRTVTSPWLQPPRKRRAIQHSDSPDPFPLPVFSSAEPPPEPSQPNPEPCPEVSQPSPNPLVLNSSFPDSSSPPEERSSNLDPPFAEELVTEDLVDLRVENVRSHITSRAVLPSPSSLSESTPSTDPRELRPSVSIVEPSSGFVRSLGRQSNPLRTPNAYPASAVAVERDISDVDNIVERPPPPPEMVSLEEDDDENDDDEIDIIDRQPAVPEGSGVDNSSNEVEIVNGSDAFLGLGGGNRAVYEADLLGHPLLIDQPPSSLDFNTPLPPADVPTPQSRRLSSVLSLFPTFGLFRGRAFQRQEPSEPPKVIQLHPNDPSILVEALMSKLTCPICYRGFRRSKAMTAIDRDALQLCREKMDRLTLQKLKQKRLEIEALEAKLSRRNKRALSQESAKTQTVENKEEEEKDLKEETDQLMESAIQNNESAADVVDTDQETTELRVGRCGHVFCEKCIKAHVRVKKSCPVCNQTLNVQRLYPLFL